MELQILPFALTVCKVSSLQDIDLNSELFFVGKTDEELSLVCPTESAPQNTIVREDGWRAFRICGVLDFSLVGILAKISKVLADNGIGLFAVSTFNLHKMSLLHFVESAGHIMAVLSVANIVLP